MKRDYSYEGMKRDNSYEWYEAWQKLRWYAVWKHLRIVWSVQTVKNGMKRDNS
jgi:hypothetical protein